jgi:hypothetical protein
MNLETRIAKLESRTPSGNWSVFATMTEGQLDRVVKDYLIGTMPEEREAALAEHPEFRELFEDLLPRSANNRMRSRPLPIVCAMLPKSVHGVSERGADELRPRARCGSRRKGQAR